MSFLGPSFEQDPFSIGPGYNNEPQNPGDPGGNATTGFNIGGGGGTSGIPGLSDLPEGGSGGMGLSDIIKILLGGGVPGTGAKLPGGSNPGGFPTPAGMPKIPPGTPGTKTISGITVVIDMAKFAAAMAGILGSGGGGAMGAQPPQGTPATPAAPQQVLPPVPSAADNIAAETRRRQTMASLINRNQGLMQEQSGGSLSPDYTHMMEAILSGTFGQSPDTTNPGTGGGIMDLITQMGAKGGGG